MATGRPQINRSTAVFVIVGTVMLGGAAMITRTPHTGVALTGAARPTPMVTATASATLAPSGSPSATPAAAGQPTVAGAATQAAGAPKATPAPGKGAVPASAQAPAPQPAPQVRLTLIDPDGTFDFNVRLQPGADACTVLNQAQAEGKISYVNIDYSYLSSLHSAYVRQINSYTNNWTVTVNGVAPRGCSLVSPAANDQITWRYQ